MTSLHPELLKLHEMISEESMRHDRALEMIVSTTQDFGTSSSAPRLRGLPAGATGADGGIAGLLADGSSSLSSGAGGAAGGHNLSSALVPAASSSSSSAAVDEAAELPSPSRLESLFLRAALTLLEDNSRLSDAADGGAAGLHAIGSGNSIERRMRRRCVMSGPLEKSKGEVSFEGPGGARSGAAPKWSQKFVLVVPGRLVYFKSEGELTKALKGYLDGSSSSGDWGRGGDDGDGGGSWVDGTSGSAVGGGMGGMTAGSGMAGVAGMAGGRHSDNTILLDPACCVCRPVDSDKLAPASGRESARAANAQRFAFELGNILIPHSRRLWVAKSEEERAAWVRAIRVAMTLSSGPGRDPPCQKRSVCDTLRAQVKGAAGKEEYLAALRNFVRHANEASRGEGAGGAAARAAARGGRAESRGLCVSVEWIRASAKAERNQSISADNQSMGQVRHARFVGGGGGGAAAAEMTRFLLCVYAVCRALTWVLAVRFPLACLPACLPACLRSRACLPACLLSRALSCFHSPISTGRMTNL